MTDESSDQPRTSHRRRSIGTVVLMLLLGIYWAALFYGTHMRLPPSVLDTNNVDKLVHCLAFLGLGVLLMMLRVIQGPFRWTSVVVRWLVLSGYGVFDEVTQHMVGRDAEVLDWVADSAGAAVGLCLVTWFYWVIQGKKKVLVTNQPVLDQCR